MDLTEKHLVHSSMIHLCQLLRYLRTYRQNESGDISSKIRSIFSFFLKDHSKWVFTVRILFAIHIAPNGSISMFLPQCFSKFFHMFVLIEAMIEASGIDIRTSLYQNVLKILRRQRTALSKRHTFSPLPISFNFRCRDIVGCS